MTTFLEFQTAVKEIYKRTDKDTEIARAINEAYMEMVATIDPKKQQDQIYKPVVADREEYPIPNNVLRINHPVRLLTITGSNQSSESVPLDFITKDEYDELEPNPNAPTIEGGTPSKYTLFKNSILLHPIPSQSNKWYIEVNIGGQATRLEADSDESVFQETWDETVKAGALSRAYAVIEAWDEVERWATIYRYGFAGDKGNITGGLELLKRLNSEVMKAPMIVRPKDF